MSMGIRIIWDPELPKTPEGYYQLQAGIDYAIRALEKPSDHCPIWVDLAI